ncbi:MAG: hypothetical protein AAGI49_16375 [Bacteroidota bacterium]
MKEKLQLKVKKVEDKAAVEKWKEHQLQQRLETPKRLEEVAKYLSGMMSISLTIFLIGDKDLFAATNRFWVYMASALWLLSLMITLAVQFPRAYRYSEASVASIQAMHQKVVRYKYWALVLATVLFVMALGILVLVVLAK